MRWGHWLATCVAARRWWAATAPGDPWPVALQGPPPWPAAPPGGLAVVVHRLVQHAAWGQNRAHHRHPGAGLASRGVSRRLRHARSGGGRRHATLQVSYREFPYSNAGDRQLLGGETAVPPDGSAGGGAAGRCPPAGRVRQRVGGRPPGRRRGAVDGVVPALPSLLSVGGDLVQSVQRARARVGGKPSRLPAPAPAGATAARCLPRRPARRWYTVPRYVRVRPAAWPASTTTVRSV